MTVGSLLTLDAAAASLGYSRRTLERRIAAGALNVFRDGRSVRVPLGELRRFVAERTSRDTPAAGGTNGGASRHLPRGARLWD